MDANISPRMLRVIGARPSLRKIVSDGDAAAAVGGD